MKNALKFWLVSLVLLLVHASIDAQDLAPGVYLKDGNVLDVIPTQKWIDSVAQTKPAAPVQAIISFDRLPTQQERATLLQSGIALADYIPNNSFIAFVRFPVNSALISTVAVRGIVNIRPIWKMDDRVRKLQGMQPVIVLVSFHAVVDASEIKSFIASIDGKILQGNMEAFGSYLINVAPAKLLQIAQWHGVRYINTPTNNEIVDIATKAAGKAATAAAPVQAGGYGLLGDSVAIAIGDDAPGIYHVDLKDRVVNYNPAPMNLHGVHVNGIAGGSGMLDPYARGVAPHVTLVDHQFDNVIAATPAMYGAYKIVATNNSYSVIVGDCGYTGKYDVYSSILDTVSLRYRNVLHVFASANDGYLTCSPYATMFGTIAGGYQTSKNALVTGNSNKLLSIRHTSSSGPTRDGRLKPDVSAVGVDVYSTVNVNEYMNMIGTSMASPGVTGTVALLAQRYKQLFGNNTQPPSDVMKALISNGATDYGNPGPDYKYGFGFINLYRSLQMLDNGRYYSNAIATGNQQAQTINVPANTAQLKVMLYWHDAPANPMVQHQLVNDLDISVQTPLGTRMPLVLDTLPANVNNNATERPDHINNCEQVVIANPAAGAYTVLVSGYHTPTGTVPYVVSYDFVPVGIRVDYPHTGAAAISTDTIRIYWDASDDNNTFTLQYSTDNGANWNTIDNNVPASFRYYNWLPPAISSGGCMIRISRNNTGQQYTTGAFVMHPQTVATLDSIQCPGYIAFHWTSVPNVTAYQVWQKKGVEMSAIDTVNATNYVVKGLRLDSTYYIAVSPIVGGLSGYRSIAVGRKPNTGTCQEAYSANDVMLQQIIEPTSGRQNTSTALTNNETISLVLRNLSQSTNNSNRIDYSIDNGPWQSVTIARPIPANDTIIAGVTGIDLSATGTHTIRVVITTLSGTDPVHENDTLEKAIVNIPNPPISLATTFLDDFEAMDSITLLQAAIGISPNGIWDYAHSSDTGRLRSTVDDSVDINGNRAISLDAIQSVRAGIQNYFTGTFNLANYNAGTSEVRFEFDYVVHGLPKFTDGNDVWVRGNDIEPWIQLYKYRLDNTGSLNNSGTLSLSDAMLQNGQNFSSSLQVRFGQHDTSVIAASDYGNGLTIDNVKVYTVQNDIQLLSVVSPAPNDCDLGNEAQLVVNIRNGVNITLSDVHLFYQLDNGTIHRDTLVSIGPKNTLAYTFKQPIDLSALGQHMLNVWITVAGDTYLANDTILNYRFHNQPLITAYPYLQNFEANDGFWYAEGKNSSWQYGTPATPIINKAASGTKVWKTNLTGKYSSLEQSYLYSPCFDIASLGTPMLSFSMAMDIEDCGDVLCDAAYMEYSFDGSSWAKLGAAGQGTNWYNKSNANVWSERGNARWRVASIPLPKGNGPIRFRFVMSADPGLALDGLAIDDIHVYDRQYPIYAGADVSLENDLGANLWTSYISDNKLIAQMQSGANIKNITTNAYRHDALNNPGSTQYLFPESFVVRTEQPISSPVNVRLYVTEADFVKMLNDSTCPSCTKPEDAYRLGITQYSNRNAAVENGSLTDNDGGRYTFHPSNEIQWVPYDAGYYAQIALTSFSELWLNDGGPFHNTPVGDDYLTFDARKITPTQVQIDWTSYIDTGVSYYEVQRSYHDNDFIIIGTQQAVHQDFVQYARKDTPHVDEGGVVYYRLRWHMNDGDTLYSPIRQVDWTAGNQLIALYPNPVFNGNLFIKWTANTGEIMQLAMYDIMGRRIYQAGITATQWNNYTEIQTDRLAPGMYFIKMKIGDKFYERKLIYQ